MNTVILYRINNRKVEVKQDRKVQLQVMNDYIKSNFI